MKEMLLQLAAYNYWANSLLLATIDQLPEEKQTMENASSFPSLYKTVLHMWDAESIWWQRVKLLDRLNIPSENFRGDMKELSQALLLQNKLWNEWISGNQEYMLQHVFQYQNSKREQFKQPVYQMLLHLFNHGTYHRGQLVTLLRQVGVEKIPATDFIIWSRRQKVTGY
jgi:uncharacterized damage-inducible protein DinB